MADANPMEEHVPEEVASNMQEPTFKRGKVMQKPVDESPTKTIQRLEDDKAMLESMVSGLKDQLDVERRSHEDANKLLASAREGFKKVQRQLDAVAADREKWKQKAWKFEQRAGGEELEKECEGLRKGIAAVQKRLDERTKELEAAQNEISLLGLRIRELQAQIARLESSTVMMQKARDTSDKERNAAVARAALADQAVQAEKEKVMSLQVDTGRLADAIRKHHPREVSPAGAVNVAIELLEKHGIEKGPKLVPESTAAAPTPRKLQSGVSAGTVDV